MTWIDTRKITTNGRERRHSCGHPSLLLLHANFASTGVTLPIWAIPTRFGLPDVKFTERFAEAILSFGEAAFVFAGTWWEGR